MGCSDGGGGCLFPVCVPSSAGGEMLLSIQERDLKVDGDFFFLEAVF